jgi:hypothetical protein
MFKKAFQDGKVILNFLIFYHSILTLNLKNLM